jgi:hypothetical protein
MITPLILPKAGGLNYANGDVRHLTATDANSAATISFATRNLAERDNVLAAVINQIISEVNNKEQIIDLPVPRISLGASQSATILNYRIPSGFEARILNVVVASTPSNTVRLEVLWSSTYGSTTGTSITSTLSEVSGQTTFYGEGEFVLKVTNISSSSAAVCGDVQITMRPVAEVQGSLLVPTVGSSGGSGSGESGYSGTSGFSGVSGTRGASGFSGFSGPVGGNAYSTTSALFVMPSPLANVTVTVDTTAWIAVGQVVYVETAGYFTVYSIGGATSVVLTNTGYAGNAAAATNIASGQQIAPAGISGAAGASASSNTITTGTVNIGANYSGTTTSASGSYAALVNGASTLTVATTTITIGANTFMIAQGQFRVMMRSGDLVLTLPSPFTTSNTFFAVTVDDVLQSSGQTYKVIAGSPFSNITITLPSGYTSDARVSISYIGVVVA